MTSLGVRSRRTAALAALIASTLALVGCSDDPVSPGNQEIVIGGLFSLTGNWSSLGTASKAAMEIGIEDVNAYLADGNTGIHFAASIKDTKLDPPTALTAVTALKDAGVEVVLGPQSSAEVAAINRTSTPTVCSSRVSRARPARWRYLTTTSSASRHPTRSKRSRSLA